MTAHNEQHERHDTTGPFMGPRRSETPWRSDEINHGPFERRRAGDRRSTQAAAAPEVAETRSESTGSEAEGGRRERRRRWGRRKSDVLSSEARDTFSSKGQSLVRRFREPIIGLTLAGVAAPLVNAGINPAEAPATSGPERQSESPVPADRDLDLAVGDYWAEAESEAVREQTIEGAVVRYDIDRRLAQKIYDAATRYEIEPDVAFGLVFTESTFRNGAVSHVGARGLTQLMPRTAKWLDPTVNVRDLANPDTNLDLGFKYLRQLIDRYEGDVDLALTAYNRGPGTVDKVLRRGGDPDNGYAGKVLSG